MGERDTHHTAQNVMLNYLRGGTERAWRSHKKEEEEKKQNLQSQAPGRPTQISHQEDPDEQAEDENQQLVLQPRRSV